MSAPRRGLRWIAAEFDRRAASYDGSRMHRWQAELAAQLLEPQPGQRVLDVATGTGLAIRAAATRSGATTTFVGLDLSEQMLQTARQTTSGQPTPDRQSFVRADAHHLPFRPEVFDAIVCVAAVPYLHLEQAAAEWRRVGRSGGVVVFTTPAAGGLSVHRLLTAAAAEHNVIVPDPHAALGSEPALRRVAQRLQLTVEVVVRHSLPEPLPGTPERAFQTMMDYGFADPLSELPAEELKLIFAAYRRAHLEAQRAQRGSQDWLFTRCRLP